MQVYPFSASCPDLAQIRQQVGDEQLDAFFERVKYDYAAQAAEGLFAPLTGLPSVFAYRIVSPTGAVSLGVLLCVNIKAFLTGQIRRHEHTMVQNENLQAELLIERQAAVKPILLTHPMVESLQDFLGQYIQNHPPLLHFNLPDGEHTIWRIAQTRKIADLKRLFKSDIPVAYIADGHHRAASVASAYQANKNAAFARLYCAFFPAEQLHIHAFHRLVRHTQTMDSLLRQLADIATLTPLEVGVLPTHSRTLSVYFSKEKRWFSLVWNDSVWQQYSQAQRTPLDAHILGDLVLKPLLDIQNIRTDPKVKYLEGTRAVAELEATAQKSDDVQQVLFCLAPITFAAMQQIVDSGGTLPPKSTFFIPRMRNGVVVYGF
jgi:uncharacterized protein (DUF1015 family)